MLLEEKDLISIGIIQMGPRFMILSIVNKLKKASYSEPESGELSQQDTDDSMAGPSTSSQTPGINNRQQSPSATIAQQVYYQQQFETSNFIQFVSCRSVTFLKAMQSSGKLSIINWIKMWFRFIPNCCLWYAFSAMTWCRRC